MRIIIETLPVHQQRYSTAGDYYIHENGDWVIKVSELNHELYNVMIAVHEIIEFALLRHRKFSDKDIDAFDLEWEERLIKGKIGPESEPGFAADCPYIREHTMAMAIEMQMCAMAGVNWEQYNEAIAALFKEKPISQDDHTTIATILPKTLPQ